MADRSEWLRERVEAAYHTSTPLAIRGGGSKEFYGRRVEGEPLHAGDHAGIVSYEPSELVVTARSGTSLLELQQTLADAGQMLPFEPPHFAFGATLGGTVAAGLSGPRRPYTGAVRDFVLGTRVINGRGELLRFGGEVIKNVAGYDLSRAMAGALGTLGLLLEVSLKVLPRPPRETTLAHSCTVPQALELLQKWAVQPLPISGGCHFDNTLFVRLSGSAKAVQAATAHIGGEQLEPGHELWSALRDHQLPFFQSAMPLWRLSLPPDAPHEEALGDWLIDWGGAQRWLLSDRPTKTIRACAAASGGHATLFRGGDRTDVFHPPAPGLMALQRRLKAALDPKGILNRGRLYQGL